MIFEACDASFLLRDEGHPLNRRRFRAWPRRQRLPPPPQIAELLRDLDPRRPGEIERHQAGNVGDAEPFAGDEFPIPQFPINDRHGVKRLGRADPGEFGDLRDLHLGHVRVSVAKRVRDMKKQAQFQPPLPHLDHRPPDRADAEQGRLRMKLLEIAADGDRFADDGSVVEHEDGRALERIECGEFGRALFERAEVDLLDRQAQSLLGQVDQHAPRIGRARGAVEPHDPPRFLKGEHARAGRVKSPLTGAAGVAPDNPRRPGARLLKFRQNLADKA